MTNDVDSMREVHLESMPSEPRAVEREAVEFAAAGPDIEWQDGYDRASVEQFFAEVEAERGRLTAEIADAQERLQRAQGALEARRLAGHADFTEIVAAAQRELAAVEEEHRELVAAIRKAAVDEAARVLAAARAEAAAVRAMVSTLHVDLSAEEQAPPADTDALSWHPGETGR